MNKLALLPLALIVCTSSGRGSSADEDGQLTVADLQTEQGIIARADFSTATSIPANVPPAVSVSVTDDAARQLFGDTLALPVVPPGLRNCPADFGITYSVTFYDYSPDASPVTATLYPTGCQTVSITTKTGSIAFQTNPEYWANVASDLGITESTIFPYAPPSD